jgi:hypothetical protein
MALPPARELDQFSQDGIALCERRAAGGVSLVSDPYMVVGIDDLQQTRVEDRPPSSPDLQMEVVALWT